MRVLLADLRWRRGRGVPATTGRPSRRDEPAQVDALDPAGTCVDLWCDVPGHKRPLRPW